MFYVVTCSQGDYYCTSTDASLVEKKSAEWCYAEFERVVARFLDMAKIPGVITDTEGKMRKSKPGYEDYVARTSGFVPWFPRAHPLPEGEGGARR